MESGFHENDGSAGGEPLAIYHLKVLPSGNGLLLPPATKAQRATRPDFRRSRLTSDELASTRAIRNEFDVRGMGMVVSSPFFSFALIRQQVRKRQNPPLRGGFSDELNRSIATVILLN